MNNADTQQVISQLSEILKKMPEQAVICDSSGKILFANEAVTEFTGYSTKECINKKLGELWGFNMAPEFYEKMWYTLRDLKIPFSADVQNIKKDNTVIWQELNIFPILDEQGDILLLLGIEPDLQKYPEESKERLLQLQELLSDQENHPNPEKTIQRIQQEMLRRHVIVTQ